MWQCLKKLISNKTINTSDEILFENGKSDKREEISEKFNEYFVDSVININNQIPNSDRQMCMMNRNDIQFKFEQIRVEQLGDIVKAVKQKVNKSEICNANTQKKMGE